MDVGLLGEIVAAVAEVAAEPPAALVLAGRDGVFSAGADLKYGLTEVQVGVPYPQAAIGVVRAELAPQATRVLALGAELHDAQACRRLGVFEEVHPPAEVLPRAVELAGRLAGMPPAIYARTKRDLRGAALDAMRAAAAEDPLLDRWLASPTS